MSRREETSKIMKEEEDSNSVKAAQYVGWRGLRVSLGHAATPSKPNGPITSPEARRCWRNSALRRTWRLRRKCGRRELPHDARTQ